MVSTTPNYRNFLRGKRIEFVATGFDVSPESINQQLFLWQRDIVRWALRRGRAALFEDCGMGKTAQQLEWASHVCRHTNSRVLLLTPMSVAPQTIREATKFGIETPIKHVRDNADCIDGISVTNYERLHLFDCSQFAGVVLDESSILKSFTGATKRKLIRSFASTPYRLACTATPAPNDLMELGNHSEFLGAMPSNEMLSVWFINDTMKCGKYRLRKHAIADFWRWVSSWGVCLASPADIGHDATSFQLPPLKVVEHVVESKSVSPGRLFGTDEISATGIHREKRATLAERSSKVAEIINGDCDQWCVWCDTNYEADVLTENIDDAIEVRGSHSEAYRDDAFSGFVTGRYRHIITKADIAGFGLNWQHCHKATWFAGYSYEKWYQAIRRLWRFGQQREVEAHIVMSDAEQSIAETMRRKASSHIEMQAEMAHAMGEFQIESVYGGRRKLRTYTANHKMEVPQWLQPKC